MKLSQRTIAGTLAVILPACSGSQPQTPPPPPAQQATPLPGMTPDAGGVPRDAPPRLDEPVDVPPETLPPATRPLAPPRRETRRQPTPKPRTPPRTAPPAIDREAYERDLEREKSGRERREREEAEERERAARRVTLPEGAAVRILMNKTIASNTSRAGDEVEARIEGASGADGEISIPKGSVLRGHVEEAVGSGRVKGRARLRVVFDEIVTGGVAHKIHPIVLAREAEADTRRDVAIAGGAAAAGAILGGILGGGDGAKKGAVIGGAAGAGGVLATKGSEVVISPGERQTVRVRETIRVE